MSYTWASMCRAEDDHYHEISPVVWARIILALVLMALLCLLR